MSSREHSQGKKRKADASEREDETTQTASAQRNEDEADSVESDHDDLEQIDDRKMPAREEQALSLFEAHGLASSQSHYYLDESCEKEQHSTNNKSSTKKSNGKKGRKKGSQWGDISKQSHTTPVTYPPLAVSTHQATVESMSNDYNTSEGVKTVWNDIDSGALGGPIHKVAKGGLDGLKKYRRAKSSMGQNQRIAFLTKHGNELKDNLAKVISGIKGGSTVGNICSAVMGGTMQNYSILGQTSMKIMLESCGSTATWNAIKLQSELEKRIRNLCLSRDGCVGVFAKMLARVMMRLITGKGSGIDVSGYIAMMDALLVSLPNTCIVEETGEERTLTTTDKKHATEVVISDFGFSTLNELLALTSIIGAFHYEICVAAHGKAMVLLAATGIANKFLHRSVTTTGRTTDHTCLYRKVYHGQPFLTESIVDCTESELKLQDNSISAFYQTLLSAMDPSLHPPMVVYPIATSWGDKEKKTPEQIEFLRQFRSQLQKSKIADGTHPFILRALDECKSQGITQYKGQAISAQNAMNAIMSHNLTQRWKDSTKGDKIIGVRETPSGTWSVFITYDGKSLYIGVYSTQDEAAIANRAARELLEQARSKQLPKVEFQSQAREAAQKAVDSSKSESVQLSSAQVRYLLSLPESTDEELKQTENPPDGSILQEYISVGSVESIVDLASNDVDMELDDGFSNIYHMLSYQQSVSTL